MKTPSRPSSSALSVSVSASAADSLQMGRTAPNFMAFSFQHEGGPRLWLVPSRCPNPWRGSTVDDRRPLGQAALLPDETIDEDRRSLTARRPADYTLLAHPGGIREPDDRARTHTMTAAVNRQVLLRRRPSGAPT